jgi:uncharacterized protein
MILGSYLGVIVNGLAVLFGGVIGSLLGKRVPKNFQEAAVHALSLVIILIGLQMALQSERFLLLTLSMLLGGLTGELFNIQSRLNSWGKFVEEQLKVKGGQFSNAFIFGTILYCVGAMAIMGSLESGLTGKHTILYTKALLDGTIAVAFASTMGIGISLAAGPIIIYQGALVFLAQRLSPLLTEGMINELTAVGGLLILSIGLNVLELTKLRIANMLPALLFIILFTYLF